jgi:cytochrome c oxidase subunit III
MEAQVPEAPDRFADMDGRRSSAWWGALFGVLVVAAVLGYLVYAYFYLYVTIADWPPEGIPNPPLLEPAVVAAVAVAGLLPLWSVLKAGGTRDVVAIRRGAAGVTVAGVVLLAAVGVLLARVDLGDLGDAITAYSSIVLTLHAYQALLTAVGITIGVVIAYQATLGESPSWVWSAGAVLEVWWSFVVLGWLAVLGVGYVWPQLV